MRRKRLNRDSVATSLGLGSAKRMPTKTPTVASCVVVTSVAATAKNAIENDIGHRLSIEGGGLLTYLATSRNDLPQYVLSRAAWKLWLARCGGNDTAALDQLKSLGGVAAVEKVDGTKVHDDYMRRPTNPTPAPPGDGWHLKHIRAPEAWALFGGGLDARAWSKVKVGHIDTGIAPHPAFGGGPETSRHVLWHEGVNYKEGGFPIDPLNYPGQPGHGVKTASVIAGFDEANGCYGVAPGASVVPYRVTNSVVVDFLNNKTALDKAITHAVAHAGCRVVSISLGDPCNASPAVGAAVDLAYNEGVIIVAAAGNVTSEVTYPGRYARTIAAGGCTKNNRPWQGASRGVRVDLSAPAADVRRAEPNSLYAGGGDGTSYATAQIAGAAVLWLAYRGDEIDRAYVEGWQVVEAFRTLARASARVPDNWPEREFGAGVLDCEALLKASLPAAASLVKKEPPAEKERV